MKVPNTQPPRETTWSRKLQAAERMHSIKVPNQHATSLRTCKTCLKHKPRHYQLNERTHTRRVSRPTDNTLQAPQLSRKQKLQIIAWYCISPALDSHYLSRAQQPTIYNRDDPAVYISWQSPEKRNSKCTRRITFNRRKNETRTLTTH
jgi:hypothetical protein